MHTEMRKTIEQKIKEHSKSGRSLEPIEEADMAVEMRCSEALQQFCQTQDTEYVRGIQHKDMGLVSDISADVHGNLYMTDYRNTCIQVFTANGVFLRSLGHD